MLTSHKYLFPPLFAPHGKCSEPICFLLTTTIHIQSTILAVYIEYDIFLTCSIVPLTKRIGKVSVFESLEILWHLLRASRLLLLLFLLLLLLLPLLLGCYWNSIFAGTWLDFLKAKQFTVGFSKGKTIYDCHRNVEEGSFYDPSPMPSFNASHGKL